MQSLGKWTSHERVIILCEILYATSLNSYHHHQHSFVYRKHCYPADFAKRKVFRIFREAKLSESEMMVSLYREVFVHLSHQYPDRLGCTLLVGFSSALYVGFVKTSCLADLEEAIVLGREALELRPPPHPHRSNSLHDLSAYLAERSNKTGRPADLEEAILLVREALELRSSPHPQRSVSLYNLAACLSYRFNETGQLADIEEAVHLSRQALELRPPPPSSPIKFTPSPC
jgi:tetratricopeptide (TPR) repeat protein